MYVEFDEYGRATYSYENGVRMDYYHSPIWSRSNLKELWGMVTLDELQARWDEEPYLLQMAWPNQAFLTEEGKASMEYTHNMWVSSGYRVAWRYYK